MTGRVLGGLALAAGGLAVLVAIELHLLSRREFLPPPDYRIDARFEPADGASAAASPPLRLAVLGDSTVAGIGSPTAETSLPGLIASRLADRLGRPVEVVGFGVSGARTADVADAQVERVLDGFDVVVVVIGSNDATHATAPWDVRRDTERLLARLRDAGLSPVLAGTPRFSGNRIIPEPIKTAVDVHSGVLRGAQRAAAEAVPGARFVDIAADASPRFVGRPDATSSDGFHPSPVGYGFWADAIAPVVEDAVRGG